MGEGEAGGIGGGGIWGQKEDTEQVGEQEAGRSEAQQQ